MPPPVLTPLRVAEAVVDRVLGFASPETNAVNDLLISVDPESVREAEACERRVRHLVAHAEDPACKFGRLSRGR